MAFDLYAIQKSVMSHLRTNFTQFKFFRNTIPEDQEVPRPDGSEVEPFFVVQFGPMMRRPRGGSVAGPRNDEYYTWMQVISVGSVDEHISDALSLVVDRLIGFKPAGASALIPDGGPGDFGSRQYSVRPVLYYASQRFELGIRQNGMSGFLSA